MTSTHNSVSKLRSFCRMSRIFAVATLSVLVFNAMRANATQYFYSGRDATYSTIIMEIYVTPTPAGNDVTGTVRCGNVLMYVKGMLAGGNLNADITYQPSAGTAAVAAASGTLFGALGSGVLNVTTGAVNINGRAVTMEFALTPPAPSTVAPPRPTISFAQQPAPTLASARHLAGGTSFGYTRVTLNLNLALNGGAYAVNGTIVVNQLVLVQFQPARNVQTVLQVSGMLTPGKAGTLNVTGAPSGNAPRFAGTLSPSGSQFQGYLSGIPSLGITGLGIAAQP